MNHIMLHVVYTSEVFVSQHHIRYSVQLVASTVFRVSHCYCKVCHRVRPHWLETLSETLLETWWKYVTRMLTTCHRRQAQVKCVCDMLVACVLHVSMSIALFQTMFLSSVVALLGSATQQGNVFWCMIETLLWTSQALNLSTVNTCVKNTCYVCVGRLQFLSLSLSVLLFWYVRLPFFPNSWHCGIGYKCKIQNSLVRRKVNIIGSVRACV